MTLRRAFLLLAWLSWEGGCNCGRDGSSDGTAGGTGTGTGTGQVDGSTGNPSTLDESSSEAGSSGESESSATTTGMPMGECGNGVLEIFEECDGSDACSDSCELPAGVPIWMHEYGAENPDFGMAVALAPNDDVIVVGSGGPGWLRRYDAEGNLIFEVADDGGAMSLAQLDDVIVEEDGDLLVTGRVDEDMVILRYDAMGALLHTETITDGELAYGVSLCSVGGGYAATAFIQHDMMPDEAWVRVHEADDTIRWTEVVTMNEAQVVLLDCVGTDDGGVVAVGTIYPEADEPPELLMRKYDAAGDQVWEVDWSPSYEVGNLRSVALEADGTLHVAGDLTYVDIGILYARVSPQGVPELEASWRVDGQGLDTVTGIAVTDDALYFSGSTTEGSFGKNLVARTTRDAIPEWFDTFGGDGFILVPNGAHDIAMGNDGNPVAVGAIVSDTFTEAWVRKYEP